MPKRSLSLCFAVLVPIWALLLSLFFLRVITASATPIYVYSAYSSSYPKVWAGNSATGKIYLGRVGSFPTGDVIVIDDQTGSITATVPLSYLPQALAVNQTTNKTYIVPWPNQGMYILDGATNTITNVINSSSSSNYQWNVAVNPTTNKVYIAGYSLSNNYIDVFDATSLQYGPTLDLGPNNLFTTWTSEKMAVVTSTNKIYVAVVDSVAVINGTTDSISTTIPVGIWPADIVVNPNTGYLYVANRDSGNVSVISGLSDSVVATVTVGISPTAVVLNPLTNMIYVANNGDGTVSVIDGASNTISATVIVSGTPSLLRIDATLNRIYVGTGTHFKAIDGTTNAVYEPDLVYQPGHAYYWLQDLLVMPSHKVYVADRHNYDSYGWWYILADIDLANSMMEALPSSLPADAISKSTITVTLQDSLGVPVSGVGVSLTVSGSGNTIAGSGAKTGINGQMTGQLWSTFPEQKVVTATLSEGKSLSDTVVITFTSPLLGNKIYLPSIQR